MRPSGYFFKNRHAERQLFLSRTLFAAIGTVVLASVLISQMVNLQVSQHDHFTVRSKDNRIRVLPLPPTRGLITDREGRALAENLPTYRLELIPEEIKDLPTTLDAVKELVDISELEQKRFERAWKRRRGNFSPVPLKFRLSQEQLAKLAINQHKLSGVSVSAHLTRYYPYEASTAHVIGYVGRIDQKNLENVDRGNYAGTTHFGKTGIERAYEDRLHGWVGEQRVESNAAGRQLRVVESELPVPGENIQLSLDVEFQRYAESQLPRTILFRPAISHKPFFFTY